MTTTSVPCSAYAVMNYPLFIQGHVQHLSHAHIASLSHVVSVSCSYVYSSQQLSRIHTCTHAASVCCSYVTMLTNVPYSYRNCHMLVTSYIYLTAVPDSFIESYRCLHSLWYIPTYIHNHCSWLIHMGSNTSCI